MYGITSQLRRAAYSVETQFAEGFAMRTKDHRRLYYVRARGSAVEIDNFLQLSHELGYLKDAEYKLLLQRVNGVISLLCRTIDSLNGIPTNNQQSPMY
jgi:four helix bundle protein